MSNYIYLPSKDLYLAPDGSAYTDEQIDDLDRMEREWRASQPNLSFSELMKIYPEAIRPARKGLNAKIKKYKEIIQLINQSQEEYYNNRILKAHFQEQAELKEESDKEFETKRKAWESKIRGTMFKLSYLNELEGKAPVALTNGVSEADIARAKQVPIDFFFTGHLHKHGKLAVGQCPFHNERTASFTIYLEQNSFWCYGCQIGGSVVDYVMKQNDVDFLTAVKQILK